MAVVDDLTGLDRAGQLDPTVGSREGHDPPPRSEAFSCVASGSPPTAETSGSARLNAPAQRKHERHSGNAPTTTRRVGGNIAHVTPLSS